eukprot:13034764-Ditylum_brightwellii.AAC.1
MNLQLDSGDNENSKSVDNAGDDGAPGEAQVANEAEVDGLGTQENTRGKFSVQGKSVDFTKPTSDAAVPSSPAATQGTITEEVGQDATIPKKKDKKTLSPKIEELQKRQHELKYQSDVSSLRNLIKKQREMLVQQGEKLKEQMILMKNKSRELQEDKNLLQQAEKCLEELAMQ